MSIISGVILLKQRQFLDGILRPLHTFPAIALATAYLHYVKGISLDESVVVCPVDPYVNDDYFDALKDLSDLAQDGAANLMRNVRSRSIPRWKS